MDNWIKVERGIRYREHPTQKHGVPRHLDRHYVIRLRIQRGREYETTGNAVIYGYPALEH